MAGLLDFQALLVVVTGIASVRGEGIAPVAIVHGTIVVLERFLRVGGRGWLGTGFELTYGRALAFGMFWHNSSPAWQWSGKRSVGKEGP